RTHARSQFSLKDRKAKSDESNPFTPASVSPPPPLRPNLNCNSVPQTPAARVWCDKFSGSDQRLLCIKNPEDQQFLRYSNHRVWDQQSFHGRSHFPILTFGLNNS
ncbi:hypothetical protein COCON_G00083950, partial [Conger conger]